MGSVVQLVSLDLLDQQGLLVLQGQLVQLGRKVSMEIKDYKVPLEIRANEGQRDQQEPVVKMGNLDQ